MNLLAQKEDLEFRQPIGLTVGFEKVNMVYKKPNKKVLLKKCKITPLVHKVFFWKSKD